VAVVTPCSVGCSEAETWAKRKQITRPADVWLWVQGVDALCLRYLLNDPEVTESQVVDAYREQFAFGSSQRVKSSVMDQFGFMEEVLQGRSEEEKRMVAFAGSHAANEFNFPANGSSFLSPVSYPDIPTRDSTSVVIGLLDLLQC
jgi:hypothetical protein